MRLPRAEGLVPPRQPRIERPAQPVAHHRRIQRVHGQQNHLAVRPHARNIPIDLLFPVRRARKFQLIAHLVVQDGRAAALVDSPVCLQTFRRQRDFNLRGHILALDCLIGRDIHQRQPGENDLRIAVRRVGVGENLVAVALPNRRVAVVKAVIVGKAEAQPLRRLLGSRQLDFRPLRAVFKPQRAVEHVVLRVIGHRNAVAEKPRHQRLPALLARILQRPDFLNLAHRLHHRPIRRAVFHRQPDGAGQRGHAQQQLHSLHRRRPI